MTTKQSTRQQREKSLHRRNLTKPGLRQAARAHRMSLPTPADLRDCGIKTTHVIARRRGRTQLARVLIALPASADRFFVGLLMRDTLKNGVKDLAITGLTRPFRAGRRIDFEEIFQRASRDYNVPDAKVPN